MPKPEFAANPVSVARFTGEARSTTLGTVMDTARYLAPDLIAGGEASPASDVYAAGITLHELLAGPPHGLIPAPLTGSALSHATASRSSRPT